MHSIAYYERTPRPRPLLLSRFSRVRLCVTPQTEAHQASLSLGFSRQEHWSGLPFPSPMHESEKKVKLLGRVRLFVLCAVAPKLDILFECYMGVQI